VFYNDVFPIMKAEDYARFNCRSPKKCRLPIAWCLF